MSAVEWATATGPPNWVFVLALLTAPVKWTRWAVAYARKRHGFPPEVEESGEESPGNEL